MICGLAALAQNVRAPFSIVLATANPSIKPGTDVWVKIQLTNNTRHDLSLPVMDINGVDAEYQFDVRSTDGSSVAKIVNAHPEIKIGSIKSRTVKPGESTRWEEVRASKVYDMSRPGEYVIQVSRVVSENATEGIVKSNTITITVTE